MSERIRVPGAGSHTLYRTLCGTLVLAVGFSCASASGSNGDLDTTFGSGGLARVGLTDARGEGAYGPVIQPDGKILICEARSTGTLSGDDMFVARFNAQGTLDTDFGSDGVATIDFAGAADACRAIALQADGRIVVAGNTQGGGHSDFAIVRLTEGGLPDPDFGGGTGKVVLAFDLGGGDDDQAYGIAVQDDQKIVVAGFAQTASHGYDFAAARLLADGGLDAMFNGTGKVTLGFDLLGSDTEDDSALALALDAQQRIVLGGIAKRGPSGAMANDFAVARLLADGSPDPSFDGDGRATVAFDIGISAEDQAPALMIQSDGRIVLAGGADTSPNGTQNFDTAVARLLPGGAPDPDFGTGGKVTFASDLVANGQDAMFAVTEQPNGKLLLGGYAQYIAGPSPAFLAAAVRLNRDGGFDSSFGTQGRKTYNFGLGTPSTQLLRGVAFGADGIVASGTATVGITGELDDFVVRLLDDLIFGSGFE
jgi:uncharacterized delta-60 repeat protein